MQHALTILATPDVAASTAFFTAALARTPDVQVSVYTEYTLPGGQRLGLYAVDALARITGQAATQPPQGGLSPAELYFYPDDMAAALRRFEAAGARVLSPLSPRPWGDHAAYFAGPFGTVLVLAAPGATPGDAG